MAFRIKPKGSSERKNVYHMKTVGEIRNSQIITTYGPGALIDFPRMSGIINGIDNWENTLGKDFDKMIIHERNLEKILGKNHFIQPKASDSTNFVAGIPITRFPEYYYCPECGALDRYYKIEKNSTNTTNYNRDVFCGICSQSKGRNIKLIPSRFVVSCKYGHLSDFPYDSWVHRNRGKCGNPKLSIEISKTINGLDGITIKCQCGAKETLEGIMDKHALYYFKCFGDMPWLGKSEDYRSWYRDISDKVCDGELRVLQRGANNVYYSSIVSALTIPPYSSRIQRFLANDIFLLSDYFTKPEPLKSQNLEYYYNSHKNRLGCDWNQFMNELQYALGIVDSGYKTIRDLMKGEYKALCDEDCNDSDFLTIEIDVPEEFSEYISQIKVVGRLREVQVLQGFKRIAQDKTVLAPLSRKPKNWLPCNELYGEGIFIRFNEEKISKWESQNLIHYSKLVKRAANNYFVGQRVSENNIRYILLHTISHLLIRELTFQCGYTSAALKEKIYSSEDINDSMCGILIYTASSDSDGSLGGLARQGETKKLKETLFNMLENASWCSNDPICIDSQNQGYGSLNYAACHACSLLPETSCECANILLDRGSVVGTIEEPELGYFSELVK